jgi:hypothetical protein
MVAAAAAALVGTATTAFAGPTFQWVNGQVTGFTAQLPMYTVAIVDNKALRFCNPANGYDYAVTAVNLHYDMLKASFLNNRKVQVGVQNFGPDPQAGTDKLCIDRVLPTHRARARCGGPRPVAA